MAISLMGFLKRVFTTPYRPDPTVDGFLARAQTQQNAEASVTVAVLDARESEQLFGVPLARRGVQPVYLRITNHAARHLRLQLVSIDPSYFTALEAAGLNHFSLLKRLSAFGLLAWLVVPLLILVIPFKLVTALLANRRMDSWFQARAFHLRPIPPGGTEQGFVFTRYDAGTKVVHINLHATGGTLEELLANLPAQVLHVAADAPPGTAALATSAGTSPAPLVNRGKPAIEFTFSIPVPGISVDYLRHDFTALEQAAPQLDLDDVLQLADHLRNMPAVTTNARNTGTGDPVNLIIIGEFETLIGAFAARWDETELVTLATCWKTARAFLLGSAYRYSPVSPLYLFSRCQDVALQRSRRSINERLHLRLWLSQVRFRGKPVWVGQVSRDIGVRFTLKTWNLTTHRIDPMVDEARDYVVEDLLAAERVHAAGYIDGVGACPPDKPRHNLTGDPYFTDGKRAAILLSKERTPARYVEWG